MTSLCGFFSTRTLCCAGFFRLMCSRAFFFPVFSTVTSATEASLRARCSLFFAAVLISIVISFCVLLSLNLTGLSRSSTIRTRAAPLPTRMPVICACAEECRNNKTTANSGTKLRIPDKIQLKNILMIQIPVKSAGRYGTGY